MVAMLTLDMTDHPPYRVLGLQAEEEALGEGLDIVHTVEVIPRHICRQVAYNSWITSSPYFQIFSQSCSLKQGFSFSEDFRLSRALLSHRYFQSKDVHMDLGNEHGIIM